jgi:hypothetical protein
LNYLRKFNLQKGRVFDDQHRPKSSAMRRKIREAEAMNFSVLYCSRL